MELTHEGETMEHLFTSEFFGEWIGVVFRDPLVNGVSWVAGSIVCEEETYHIQLFDLQGLHGWLGRVSWLGMLT